MLRFKAGVDFRGMTPQAVLAMTVADQQNGGLDTWITSISDKATGRVKGSKHETGDGVDVGIHNLVNIRSISWLHRGEAVVALAGKIRQRLAPQFQVVVHSITVPNWKPGDAIPADLHIHMEFDPK
jgi:hypothetical protein